MNHRPIPPQSVEPLDAEERALAEQLARLGPHGEPSSALDARILAAAHAAVAASPRPRQRSRWPWAMGVAATGLLAVGIAWQLRPVHEYVPAEQTQVAAADHAAGAAAPAADAAAPSQPLPSAVAIAPPAEATLRKPSAPAQVSSTDRAGAIAPPKSRAVPPPPPPPDLVAQQQAVVAAQRRAPAPVVLREAPAPAAAAAAAEDSQSLDAIAVSGTTIAAGEDYARAPAPAAPPPPPATVSADRSTRDAFGVVADPETTAAIAARREQARAAHARSATEAAEAAERKEARTRASQTSAAMQEATQPAMPSSSSGLLAGNSKAASANSGARSTLKRTDLQLPVVEDTKLEADDWLERIRLRRDLGDRASATDSLLRFKQMHPFQKVPDDLKELLAP